MKLTLRKANAVQAAINEAIKGLDLSTTVTLNEFEGVEEQIQAGRDRFLTHASTRNNLTMALYEIRAKVAQANAASGINDHLANVAYLEKQISHYNMLAGKGAQTSLRVLNGQVKKLSGVKEDGFGYRHNAVTTSIFTDDEIESYRSLAADSKREKQNFQDQLLELNVQTEIELTKDTVEALTKANIL
jgi:putative ubiquitin-RnfH superfamily antitoxin RatB of RatAB toxin-antitoxin module